MNKVTTLLLWIGVPLVSMLVVQFMPYDSILNLATAFPLDVAFLIWNIRNPREEVVALKWQFDESEGVLAEMILKGNERR